MCVACHRVFCVECATKIDGVNHCRDCLARRGAKAVAQTGRGFLARATDSVLALALLLGSLGFTAAVLVLYGDAQAHGTASKVANRDRMESVVAALRQYKRDTGSYPDENEAATLRELVVEPSGVTGWKGPYLDLSPGAVEHGIPDAYGTPVRYWRKADGTSCAVGSAGADRFFESKLTDATPLKVGNGIEAEAHGDDIVLVVE